MWGYVLRTCNDLIAWYAFWLMHGRPYVILKAAITLDGRIATATGDSQWISSEESRNYVHELRNQVDGLIVGMGTVLKDDPLLTCRMEGGRDPMRIILDPQLEIPERAKCLGHGSLVFTTKSLAAREEIIEHGTETVQMEADPSGLLPWAFVLEHLGKIGLHCVMVEGGTGVYSSLLRSGLVDKLLSSSHPRSLAAACHW